MSLLGRRNFCFCVLTNLSAYLNDLRWRHLSLHDERYRRKACQRAPKPPFGFWLFIRGFGGETYVPFYVFALVQFTRFRLVRWRAGGVRFARLRRKAKHRLFATISLPQALLPPDSCVLHVLRRNRWHSQNNQRFVNLEAGWLRKCKPFNQRWTMRWLRSNP